MSEPAARPVSDRLAGTTATREGNDGWPPGNGRASKKKGKPQGGENRRTPGDKRQALLFHGVFARYFFFINSLTAASIR